MTTYHCTNPGCQDFRTTVYPNSYMGKLVCPTCNGEVATKKAKLPSLRATTVTLQDLEICSKIAGCMYHTMTTQA